MRLRIRLRAQDQFDRMLRSIELVESNRRQIMDKTSKTESQLAETEAKQLADALKASAEEYQKSMKELKLILNRKRNEALDRQRFERSLKRPRQILEGQQSVPNQGYKRIYEEPEKAKKAKIDHDEALKKALKEYIAKMKLKFPKKVLESAILRAFGTDPVQIGTFDESTIKAIIKATFTGSHEIWNELPRGARKLVRNLRCELIGVLGRAPNEADLIANIEEQEEVQTVEDDVEETPEIKTEAENDDDNEMTFDVPTDFKVLDARFGKESAWVTCKLQVRDKFNLSNIEAHFRPTNPRKNPTKIRIFLKKLDAENFGIFVENFGDTEIQINLDSYLWDRDIDTTEKLQSEQNGPITLRPGDRVQVAKVDPKNIVLKNCVDGSQRYNLRFHFKPL